MTRMRTLGLAFLLGAAGCARQAVGTTIDYRFIGGSGVVKASLHIEPDGKMTRLTLEGDSDVTTLDPATLAELRRRIDAAQFSTLKPTYDCIKCDNDLVHTISVQIDGVTYTVRSMDTAKPPEHLGQLIEKLSTMSHAGIPWD